MVAHSGNAWAAAAQAARTKDSSKFRIGFIMPLAIPGRREYYWSKRMVTGLHVSRRRLLKGAAIAIGLPPLEAMFDSKGIAYAATSSAGRVVPAATPQTRFVLWFNGN